ncbi:hypothetical protein L596_013108 [Steinernema carpocapsae]|uniref:Uncharacterized protein n=1 Tax=Steinernema carpocapsae TaxID=34508 RepID=A0A4U5NZV1_STECR|nr:hypothetical protein L596_013108 [Steinernema carpocapsae]
MSIESVILVFTLLAVASSFPSRCWFLESEPQSNGGWCPEIPESVEERHLRFLDEKPETDVAKHQEQNSEESKNKPIAKRFEYMEEKPETKRFIVFDPATIAVKKRPLSNVAKRQQQTDGIRKRSFGDGFNPFVDNFNFEHPEIQDCEDVEEKPIAKRTFGSSIVDFFSG